jgi:ribonuclease Z
MLAGVAVDSAAAQSDSIVVTLLGTGTPNPRLERMGPSTLVEVGGKRLLFDVGRAATVRLTQAGIRCGSVTDVFITHHHSDHVNVLPDLWLTCWLPPLGGRTAPLRVWGPPGVRDLVRGLEIAFGADVRMRQRDEQLSARGIALEPREFDADTVVFNEDGVQVSAFTVDHGEFLKPAVGYRIEYRGRSVVISGDTRYSPNLVRHSANVDLLVHEVAMGTAATRASPGTAYVLAHHTSPAEAASVFSQVQPTLAVFTHLALPPTANGGPATAQDVITEARRTYRGALVMGEDLMRIVVGDTIVVRSAFGTEQRVTRRAAGAP